MDHILVLEDDRTLCSGVCMALAGEGRQTLACHTLAEARAALARRTFALLVLDVNLPDGSGLDLLRELRPACRTPVLLLTANDLEWDIVTGLEAGADDYITKPFSLAVLRARVAALLRRAGSAFSAQYRCGPFQFDFERMEFLKDGRPLELSRTEQKLLRLLVCNREQTLPRALLLDRVWGTADYVDENALSVAVKRLRDKLGGGYLHTVYGVGYVWREPQ